MEKQGLFDDSMTGGREDFYKIQARVEGMEEFQINLDLTDDDDVWQVEASQNWSKSPVVKVP